MAPTTQLPNEGGLPGGGMFGGKQTGKPYLRNLKGRTFLLYLSSSQKFNFKVQTTHNCILMAVRGADTTTSFYSSCETVAVFTALGFRVFFSVFGHTDE